MLNKLLMLLRKSNILIILIIILLIWLVAPYVHIGGVAPFIKTSVKIFLTCVVLLGFALKYAIKWLLDNKGNHMNSLAKSLDNYKIWSKSTATVIKEKAQNNMVDLKSKWHKDRQLRHLKKTPMYFILGSAMSGKRQLITNSGLRFLTSAYYGRQGVNLERQFDLCRWYFTDNSIFIDAGQYDETGSLVVDRKLIRHMRKQRKRKPISGVIFTFSLPELILATHTSRRNFMKSFSDQIKQFYQILKTPIPIYLTFTKLDLISGFAEFFSDLSKEELAQVWGVTFPLPCSSDAVSLSSFFKKEYNQMLARLQQRVLWSLDSEKKQQGRKLIFSFPQQMQLFTKPIDSFIREMFDCFESSNMIQLRGVYFTSSQQEGQPYDFFLHAIGRRYNITSNYKMHQENQDESFFAQRLFQHVIYPEHSVLGYSERARKTKKVLYRLASWGVPLITVMSCVAFHSGYQTDNSKLLMLSNSLDEYNLAVKQIESNDIDLTHTLPALNALNRMSILYSQQKGWSSLLLASSITKSSIQAALKRSLRTLFLPRIAASLEANLKYTQMGTNALYANLKGYLAFSPSGSTDIAAIRAPMKISWDDRYRNNPELHDKLRYYLDKSIATSVDLLPLDSTIVNKVRAELQEVLPQRRAYALLTIKSLASDYPAVSFSSVIGQDYYKIFIQDDKSMPIQALYTQHGFANIFEPNYMDISRQVSNDNREIGLDANHDNTQSYTQISLEMQRDYNAKYKTTWHQSLSKISIRPFNNINSAISCFDLLSSDHSPLTKLLTIVNDNTQSIKNGRINVSSTYAKLNDFSQSGITKSKLAETVEAFKSLHDYFVKIQSSIDPDKAAYMAAIDYMKDKPNNPIKKLSLIIEKSPQPLKSWLQQISNNSWSCITQGAANYLNSMWHDKVMSGYVVHIKGRYPLHSRSSSQVNIHSFADFFSIKGSLNKFFIDYLQPFVNTHVTPWKMYVIDEHKFPLSAQVLAMLQRMKMIQSLYFSTDSGKLQLDFSIVPVRLDNSLKSVSLDLGAHSILYEHGPLRPEAISWPFNENSEASKLVLSSFTGENKLVSSYGDWSLFKILDHCHLFPAAGHEGYYFTISMNHRLAKFRIITDAPISAFTLSAIKGFKLPALLYQSGGHAHD